MDYKEKLNEIKNLKINLEKDLEFLIKGKKRIKKGVYVGKNVKIEAHVYFDTSDGKILINDGTKIKAHSILRGPLLIGKNSIINSFCEISCSNIGDVCKVGGEVEGSIIQSYTNKQHYGFLGHSYVGSWVNLGAGTCVSDLKNTYSTIKMKGVDTGMNFLGCIIGDYSKSAINTSIFCGKIIGQSAHLYGTITQDVPAFTSHISTGNLYELPLEIAIRIQKAMAKRRNIEFSSIDENNFKKLYEETKIDREKANVKKGKLLF